MSLKSKEKLRILAFPHTVEIQVSPSNLKNLTASPGVERARKPSVYFFGTFFVQAKKVHIVPHPHGSREGAHTLRVLFWHLFSYERKKCGKTACNTCGRVSKNNKFIFRKSFARLTALNSSSQTEIKNQILFLRFSLKEKRIKHHFHIRGTA